MIETIRAKLVPGFKVKVIQQIAGRDYTWTSEIVGTVVNFSQQTTGSWFAHSKDDKLMARPADAAKKPTVKSPRSISTTTASLNRPDHRLLFGE